MSNRYDPSRDYRNYWNLGSTVCFDGPYGQRLTGKLVRVGAGTYVHVEVDGVRYEADIRDDNMEMVWS